MAYLQSVGADASNYEQTAGGIIRHLWVGKSDQQTIGGQTAITYDVGGGDPGMVPLATSSNYLVHHTVCCGWNYIARNAQFNMMYRVNNGSYNYTHSAGSAGYWWLQELISFATDVEQHWMSIFSVTDQVDTVNRNQFEIRTQCWQNSGSGHSFVNRSGGGNDNDTTSLTIQEICT